jgi:membrane-associated protein
MARFVPIVRTFAPFVAGIGKMTYSHFVTYNIVGGIAWVALFVFGDFYFGNLPFVKQRFTLILYLIVSISILPGVIEFLRQRHQLGRYPQYP